MRRKIQLLGLIILPMATSILSAYYKALWLIPVVVILIFILIGTMPICRKNENLWMFVLTGFCSIPVNVFLLTKFNVWMDYLYNGSGKIHKIALIIGYTIVLTGMEEIILGVLTRVLWKKQCKLYIPVDNDE
ncbi:MAG: hypothetical protein ACLTQN_07955 [Blautia massiliensis (ex Durand et al. 2017)]